MIDPAEAQELRPKLREHLEAALAITDNLDDRQSGYLIERALDQTNGGYRAFVFTDHLSSEELVRLRDNVERDVRAVLGIPFNPGAAALRYEHSMGQGLPGFIHRVGQVPPNTESELSQQAALA